jgi:hypothetical protein
VHRPNSNAGEHDSEHSVEPPSRDMSDTEDAAVKLESMAFTARAPNSQYRPQDSLPFFDNIPSPNASAQAAHGSGRMIHAYPAELTSYRTSIVAPPLVFEGPWTASAIGLDMCFNLEEMKTARSRSLATIFAQLPDKALSYKLVDKYFQEVRSDLLLSRDGADGADGVARADPMASRDLPPEDVRGGTRPRVADDRGRTVGRD